MHSSIQIPIEYRLDFLAVRLLIRLYFARREGILKLERIVGSIRFVGVTTDVFAWARTRGDNVYAAARVYPLARESFASTVAGMLPPMV